MTEKTPHREVQTLSMMYGTYADVLFVLFPFLVIVMQRLWDGKLEDVLLRPDLSVAAAILGGLAIGKFVLGLVTERDLGRYKERIVFFIAITLFVVLGPAIILILSIVGNQEIPGFVAFVQPVLLIVSISLYTTAISISNMLTHENAPNQVGGEANGTEPGQADVAEEAAPEPLTIPRRHNGESM
ncbi:MAG: hypothetical protein R3175_08315 [Marinobacter sp.]|uniref:hypothetical protein n=1 Tax=Marinobacter sp. TaxID=50741 RepID=UPI00299E52B6|nr:hypothetical protein [Marinobacter sp.]MDX1756045.1 hypothetical protein [Marinobacter sp.]